MNEKRAFLYVDDDRAVVDAFKKTVRGEWNLNYEVISNKHFGTVHESKYDLFEKEILEIVRHNSQRLECIFLDLDFGSSGEKPDKTGFLLGRSIRRQYPALPIIIATRFAEKEILRKGMIFDFDSLCDPTELIHKEVDAFNGMISLAKEKRQNVLLSIGDIPVSFKVGKHRYFRSVQLARRKGPEVFVAMPFKNRIVREDVWRLGILEGCKTAGVVARRVDEDRTSVTVIDKIATMIFASVLVIADLTGWNANVLYELGIAHTANKPCILLTQRKKDMLLPFDVRHLKTIVYKANDLSRLRDEIQSGVRDWRSST